MGGAIALVKMSRVKATTVPQIYSARLGGNRRGAQTDLERRSGPT